MSHLVSLVSLAGRLKQRCSFLVVASLGACVLLPGGQALAVDWQWTEKPAIAGGPSPRYYHAMVYDSVRKNIVMFGGRSASGAILGETWIWDGSGWSRRYPVNQPSPRYFHAMAWDYRNQNVVLFGGTTDGRDLNDTWIWDGTNWIQRVPATSPPARSAHGMAYDEWTTGKEVALFGGSQFNTGVPFDDTWYWNGSNWRNATKAQRYPARAEAIVALTRSMHPSAIGGRGSQGLVDGHWILEAGNWMKWTGGAPTDRYRGAACRDDDRLVTVLYGGMAESAVYGLPRLVSLDDTWAFNGSVWAKLSPAANPGARHGHAMAYDSQRKVIVLFGGAIYSSFAGDLALGDTWTLGEAAPTPLPDLVVESITMVDASRQPITSVQAGQAVYFSMRIVNRGTGATTAGSVHVTAYRDGLAYDSGTLAVALAAGSYQTIGTDVPWQVSAGSRTFRVDVDDTNLQPESNENNNSSTFTFNVTGGVQVSSFTANPATITAGQSTTLTWSSTGGASATIDYGVGAVATSGSKVVSPAQTTTYTLTVTGAGGSATRSVTVMVNAALPTIGSFTASPSTITAGQSTSLSWSSTGGTSATIDNGVGAVATSGSKVVSPANTTTYRLTVTGAGGSTNRSVTVTVASGGGTPTIDSFTVSPSTVRRGERATLSWSTSGAGVVTIDNGVGTVPASGTWVVTPSVTTSYRLTANPAGTGSGGAPATAVRVVAVGPKVEVKVAKLRVTLVSGEQRYVGQPFSVRVDALGENDQVVPYDGSVLLWASRGRLDGEWIRLKGGTTTASVRILDPACATRISAGIGHREGQQGRFWLAAESTSFNVLAEGVADLGGFVSFQSGPTASGANVTLTPLCGTDKPLSTASDSTGKYYFSSVKPNEYRLTATLEPFAASKPEDMSLGVQSVRKNIKLLGTCMPEGRVPVLLLPGIMGSSTDNEWEGIARLPTLPKGEVTWDDSRWGADSAGTNRFYGLYDHAAKNGGWEDLAEALVDSGYQVGCTVFPVPYDWRLEPPEIAAKFLIPRIDHAKKVSGAQKVQIVAHSMGGLVARSYLQGLARDELGRDFQARNDVERLAMVGTPNSGAPRAYLLWEGGDARLADDGEKLLFSDVGVYTAVLDHHLREAKGLQSTNNLGGMVWRAFIHESVPSIGWLQPLSLPGLAGPIRCLPSSATGRLPDPGLLPVPTKIFAGTREPTMTRIETNTVATECSTGLYPDGWPRMYVEKGTDRVLPSVRPAEGDGTVPAGNSRLGAIDWTDSKSAGHVSLVNVYRPEILEFLGVSSAGSNSNTALSRREGQGDQIVLSVKGSASIAVHTPNGKTWGVDPSTGRLLDERPTATLATPEGGQVLTLVSPMAGTYRMHLAAESEGLIMIVSRLEGERPGLSSGDLFMDTGTRWIDLQLDPARPVPVSIEIPAGPLGVRSLPYASGSGEVVQLMWTAPKSGTPASYRVVSRLASSRQWTTVGTTSGTYFTTPHEWASSSSTPVRYYAVSAIFPGGAESFLSEAVKNDDRDGDGISDEEEAEIGTNRASRDSDGDGLSDMEELEHGTAPLSVDSDGDGASDLVEAGAGTDPLSNGSRPVFGSVVAQKLVPVVLDIDTGSVHYTTEVVTTNRGGSVAEVSYLFTPAAGFGGKAGTVLDALRPGAQEVIPDMVAFLRKRGLDLGVPGSGTSIVGTVRVTMSRLSAVDSAAITARTTAATESPYPEGAAGLSYSGLDLGSISSRPLTVFAMRQDSKDRSNLAVVNTSGVPTSVRITAHSGAGDGVSRVIRSAESLPAWGWIQLTRVLEGTGISQGWVTVERVAGSGTFSAYGVINDSRTNDGSFVLPTTGTSAGSRLTVPVLVETSSFRSELVLSNRSSSSATLTIRYVESGTAALGAGGTTTVTLRPKEQLIIPEAIDWLRRRGLAIGAQGTGSFVGSLRIAVSGTSLGDIYAGARTGAPSLVGGQFGLFTPGVYQGEEAAAEAFVYGLRADPNNRSNVAVLNSGADGAGSVTLEVRSFDGDSGGVERGSPQTVSLAPGQFRQFNNILAGGGIRNGWVHIRRLSGASPWVAYGVVNDGGNPGERTGDGAYVPMTVP